MIDIKGMVRVLDDGNVQLACTQHGQELLEQRRLAGPTVGAQPEDRFRTFDAVHHGVRSFRYRDSSSQFLWRVGVLETVFLVAEVDLGDPVLAVPVFDLAVLATQIRPIGCA